MKNLIVILLFVGCFTTTLHAKVYEYTYNNHLSLLEDPEKSVDLKVELIKNAKHHVHIVSFFWDDSALPKRLADELNKANARGVEVRILTTYIATLGLDPLGIGKRALNHKSKTAIFSYMSLTPGAAFSVNNSLHEKLFLVDGEIAIIGGRNTSNSSLNGKDLEVLMKGPVVNQVQDHFKRMYDFILDLKVKRRCIKNDSQKSNCLQKYKLSRFNDEDMKFFGKQPAYLNGVKARILSHEALFHQKDLNLKRPERMNQQDDILDTVLKIKFKKLRAYNYFIIPTPKYKIYLEENLVAGNSIEMITNSYESAKFSNNYGYIYSLPKTIELVEKGLELYQWQRDQKLNYVHEKVMIFDEDHIIVGSHNFGVGSTTVSNEISVEFKSKQIADRLIDVFNNEKNDSLVTKKADLDFLKNEFEKYKNQVQILNLNIVEGILREIY